MATEDILRVHYQEGQFLTAADFSDEQAYLVEMRRRHVISEHTWGIVSGLTIEKNASGVWVVKAGVMVDAYGRETYLFADEPLNTTEIAAQLAGAANATLKIWLAYNTEQTTPAAAGFSMCQDTTQNTRTRESFLLIYQDDPSPFDKQKPDDRTKWPAANQALSDDPNAQPWPVLLGTITWTAGAITMVDPAGRQYAGLTGIEVFSQTGQFDLHASEVRIVVEGAAPAVLTTHKGHLATVPADLYLRTNDDNGGNIIHVDKDNLSAAKDVSVDGKITAKGTVGNGAGKLYVEAEKAQDLATLTRPANSGAGPAHDLAIRTNDGNGGNKILLDKDDVALQALTVSGATIVKGGLEIWGNQLLLKQSDGSDDTDPMAISRFNNGPDRNDMRIQIGDNLDGQDRLVVGPVWFQDHTFKENFSVDNQGKVISAGPVNGRNMALDGAKLDGITNGATQVAVRMGVLKSGETIPLPDDYDESQCRWIVSPNGPQGTPLGFLNYSTCLTIGQSRIVDAKWVSGNAWTTDGWVNYLIIGVR
jgi:hypothetical protein